jgi:predicted ATPase/DNA-binding winged helix-turn-helix (wHTH) protein
MRNRPGAATYRFGEIEVDPAAYELRRCGQRIRLTQQAMDLLLLLLERREELVSREDIARRLWSPDVVTDLDAGIHTAVLKIRRALGDSSASPRFVETVSRKGYRFIASVEVVRQSVEASAELSTAGRLPHRPHNLPADLTSFVGRREELLKLPAMLASSRLLSLTGAGGVGKTRLAVRLAQDVVNDFPDGVWLIELAPLAAPDLLAQTFATVVGVQEGPQRSARDALLDSLRHRALLLVVDNCEHILPACADLLEALLRVAPGVRVLATSREALGVSGETVCRVRSLSLPEPLAPVPAALPDSEATQLFVERARAVDEAFALTADTADSIVRICRRLGGIPLAIELAAARVDVLSLEQIEARLQNRFHLLTGGPRTALPRQRTLEATLDWSYQLLSDTQRQLLCRLSVFPSSWTLQAAEHVCAGEGIDEGRMLDLLSQLVNKSLVVVDSAFTGERRFGLLETVRHYARERLAQSGDAERVRARQFEFFYDEFRHALPRLRGHGQQAYLRRLRIEQENLRCALEFSLTSPDLAEKGTELAAALFWFWTKRGLFGEGEMWLERVLAVTGGVAGSLRARALIGLAHMHHFQGRHSEVAADAIEALALGRNENDAWAVSFALFLQALSAVEQGDYEQARARCLEARDAADVSGDPLQHGGPLHVLANIALSNGDYDRAHHLYQESIDVHRRAGESWGVGILLSAAAGLCIIQKDFAQARAQASEAMSLCEELEDPRGIAWSLHVSAGLLAAAGHANGAATLWGASEGLLESVSSSLVPTIGWIRDRYLDSVKTALGCESFEAAHAEGRAMTVADAMAFARQQALSLRLSNPA